MTVSSSRNPRCQVRSSEKHMKPKIPDYLANLPPTTLLSTKEVAYILQITPRCLYHRLNADTFPKPDVTRDQMVAANKTAPPFMGLSPDFKPAHDTRYNQNRLYWHLSTIQHYLSQLPNDNEEALDTNTPTNI